MIEQLIKNLPIEERSSTLITEILQAAANELTNIDEQNERNRNELFIDTAIESLKFHIRDLGLVIKPDMTLQQKRQLIIATYRSVFEQTTDETIKSVIEAFDATATIEETGVAGIYNILVAANEGTTDNIPVIESTLGPIVPAHLAFNFGTQTVTSYYQGAYSSAGIITTIYPKEVSAYE